MKRLKYQSGTFNFKLNLTTKSRCQLFDTLNLTTKSRCQLFDTLNLTTTLHTVAPIEFDRGNLDALVHCPCNEVFDGVNTLVRDDSDDVKCRVDWDAINCDASDLGGVVGHELVHELLVLQKSVVVRVVDHCVWQVLYVKLGLQPHHLRRNGAAKVGTKLPEPVELDHGGGCEKRQFQILRNENTRTVFFGFVGAQNWAARFLLDILNYDK